MKYALLLSTLFALNITVHATIPSQVDIEPHYSSVSSDLEQKPSKWGTPIKQFAGGALLLFFARHALALAQLTSGASKRAAKSSKYNANSGFLLRMLAISQGFNTTVSIAAMAAAIGAGCVGAVYMWKGAQGIHHAFTTSPKTTAVVSQN